MIFTLNYESLELYSQFMCTQEKETKIVFIFTVLKGRCDFINVDKHNSAIKGTVNSPRGFQWRFQHLFAKFTKQPFLFNATFREGSSKDDLTPDCSSLRLRSHCSQLWSDMNLVQNHIPKWSDSGLKAQTSDMSPMWAKTPDSGPFELQRERSLSVNVREGLAADHRSRTPPLADQNNEMPPLSEQMGRYFPLQHFRSFFSIQLHS